MALIEMIMPKMGESVMEGTILSWLKSPGDPIQAEESLLEVATDKVDTEIPATESGILKEILAKEGDIVQVGNPIATISTQAVEELDKEVINNTKSTITPVDADGIPSSRFYSPLVLNIAHQEQIQMNELEMIPGTGKENRVTKKDILSYIRNKKEVKSSTPTQKSPTSPFENVPVLPSEIVPLNSKDEIIEMDRMRKMTAERMLASKQISPHVSSFVEVDLTRIFAWRDSIKESFRKKQGNSFTFTPIFIQATIQAIHDFPMINISVKGNKIVKKRSINIGIAVALPSGNLIVPVVRNADHLSLSGLALKVNDLAERARNNAITPDELSDGTYTISNIGTFGNIMGTPIIMQPQVAIMAFGAIRKKPAVVQTPQGDFIGIRQLMFLSHSYDHRVVDGSLGGRFVRKVADYLENFDVSQQI